MAFDWHDYLEFARFLQTQTGAPYEEAALRTAVSRSYYAAFGHAHEYACDYLGFTPRRKPEEKSQDHGRLRSHLAKKRYAVSVKQGQLRDWRNDCDYVQDLTARDLPQLVTASIAAADYIYRSLQKPQTP